jgi:hypothetical protein
MLSRALTAAAQPAVFYHGFSERTHFQTRFQLIEPIPNPSGASKSAICPLRTQIP